MSAPSQTTVLAASASHGWLWPLVIGVVGAGLAVLAALGREPQWPQVGIGALLAALGAVTAVAATQVRYEITGSQLRLVAPPLVNERIPIGSIQRAQRRDLDPTVWASIRFPGLALRDVRYVGVGTVRMCATRAADRILVLETGDRLYGVTPHDEAAFLEALARAGAPVGE
ncbi:PH domain-containing protein [Actinomycetota bacterium]